MISICVRIRCRECFTILPSKPGESQAKRSNADLINRCVHFPHHCPCAFPQVEDKVEFGEGSMACVSKGGYKAGEAARKIELARKGLL